MRLGAFRRASKFKRLSSSRFPILCASWGLLQSKQTQQANSNALSLRGFPSCVHLGAFRRASRLNCLSSSRFPILCASWGLSQSKQIQTSFLFEVSYPVRILGPFAEQANSASKFERLVSSRFPILRTSWGLSQSKQIELPFLFEVAYLVCILGPFTEQANSNVFPLRGFLSCAHLGAFAEQANSASKFERLVFSRFPILRTSWGLSQSKQIELPFLFEVAYLVCILGPFTKQANSNVFPLRGFLSCAHLGAFCRASKLSKQIRTPCLFEVSHLAYILGPFAEQAD